MRPGRGSALWWLGRVGGSAVVKGRRRRVARGKANLVFIFVGERMVLKRGCVDGVLEYCSYEACS